MFLQRVAAYSPVHANAVKLTSEYMNFFVLEAAHRAALQAQVEGVDHVDAQHLEKILPQLVTAALSSIMIG